MKKLFKKQNLFFITFLVLNIYLLYLLLVHNFKECNDKSWFRKSETRDFFRYECKYLKRIGGLASSIEKVPNDLYR
jgi:hypothetical protein